MYWELRSRSSRFQYYNAFLRLIPGLLGVRLRRLIILRFCGSHGRGVVVHEGVRFGGIERIHIGHNVIIAADCFIQAHGGVTIGDNTLVGPGCKIWSVNHVFRDPEVPIMDQGYEHRPVVIGRNVWLAANVIVLPGVRIPDGCVVSAGTVVSKRRYAPYSILAGYPAEQIGLRRRSNPR
jgi:maltose O-acetyltransferase